MIGRGQFLNQEQKASALINGNAYKAAKDMDLPSYPSDCGAKFTFLPTNGQSSEQAQNRNGRS